MPAWKKLAVNAAILLLVAGHGIDLIGGHEHWPFSAYPMYSHLIRGERLTSLRVFGVSGDPEHQRELAIDKSKYLSPLSLKKVTKTLERLTAEKGDVPAALAEILTRYESLRLAGRHAGPPIHEVRLYRLTWHLDPWARNRDNPDQREVIAEVEAR